MSRCIAAMHGALFTEDTLMLELAILGLLKERAMHGYELRKQLGQRLGFFWSVSFGSIYPTLKKLERRGFVEKFLVADQMSRRRQVYRITEPGEREFIELISEGASSAWEEDKFPLRLAFFRYLKPETRIRLLERRKQVMQDKLAEGQRCMRNARSDEYILKLMRHGMDIAEHDVRWLDELIAAERAAIEPAGPQEASPDQQNTSQPDLGIAPERPKVSGNARDVE
ncbi:MAG: helix-turn-helix transcriptional regulator [Egibacteraceae bacterium]